MFGLLTALLLAAPPADTMAQHLMERVSNRPTFHTLHAEITLTLQDPSGRTRVRRMESWSKTDPKTHETKMLLKFLEPADVKGTAFLIHEHKDRDDDMWFYLPALRRVKRLAASGKAGAFMGSDFSNYDIGGGEVEDWNYRIVGSDTLQGHFVWIVEALPKSPEVVKKTGYTKQVKWVDPKTLIVWQTECYDRTGEKFKRIRVEEAQKVQGVWFEKRIVAENLDSGHRSIMDFHILEVNPPLSDDLFSQRALQR